MTCAQAIAPNFDHTTGSGTRSQQLRGDAFSSVRDNKRIEGFISREEIQCSN